MTAKENDFPFRCTFCGADIRYSIRHRYYDYPYPPADPETMVMSCHCGECEAMLSYRVHRYDPNRLSRWRDLVARF